MPRVPVLLAVGFALGLVLLPAVSRADEEPPSPGTVADRWQWGDRALQEKAAAVVAKASPGFLKRFQEALRDRRRHPLAAADRFIERALAGDEEAVTLLQGMGRVGLRRLLERMRDADATVARAPRPLPVAPEAQAGPGRGQVLITVEVFALPRHGAADLLGDARGGGIHLVDDVEARVIRRALERSDRAERLSAPRVLVEDRDWATVEITEETAYVRAYRTEKHGDRIVADPVIDRVTEGLFVEVRPVISADALYVTLEGRVTQKLLERPIPSKRVRVAGLEDEVEIQLPKVAESKLDLHVTLPRGGCAVGTGIPHPVDPAKELAVIVTPVLGGGDGAPAPKPDAGEDEARTVIHVEVRVLEASDEVLARVLGADVPNADRTSVTLDAARVLGLLGPTREGVEGVKVLEAPSITTFDGQKANVSILNQVSYVQDYEIETGGFSGPRLGGPVIGVIQEGLTLDLCPRVSADRKAIRLDAEAAWADLARPIPEFKTKLVDQEVTIQLPEVTVVRVKEDCRLAPGSWVLLGGLGKGSHGRRCLLMHAKVTDLDEVERGGGDR